MSGNKVDATMSEVNIHTKVRDARSFERTSTLARFFLSVLTLLRSIKFQRRERFMRLCETLPLGEKRFLAIVQIEHRRFLIATTNQSISLLYCLEGSNQSHPRPPADPSDSRLDGIR